IVPGQGYHAQVTDHYCASATVQMMLDNTAVRTTNAYINTFLNAPDPAPIAPDGQFHNLAIPPQPTYVGGQVTFAPQVAIYNLLHDITGFYVNDPWTGYAKARNLPNNMEGLGVRAWVKYGWSRSPVAPIVNVPGVGLVQARPNEWFRYFNPAPGFPGEGAYMG